MISQKPWSLRLSKAGLTHLKDAQGNVIAVFEHCDNAEHVLGLQERIKELEETVSNLEIEVENLKADLDEAKH